MNDEPMQQETDVAQQGEQKCTLSLADKLGVSPTHIKQTVKKKVLGGEDADDGNLALVMMTADRYDLNPMMGEIHAMPTRGGLQICTGVDGFLKIANRHPQYDGMDVEFEHDNAHNVKSCTVTVYRKDREHPTPATEYMEECEQDTQPWRERPHRMLKHKAAKEAIRYAFAITGLQDIEEAQETARNRAGNVQKSGAHEKCAHDLGLEAPDSDESDESGAQSEEADDVGDADGPDENADETDTESPESGEQGDLIEEGDDE